MYSENEFSEHHQHDVLLDDQHQSSLPEVPEVSILLDRAVCDEAVDDTSITGGSSAGEVGWLHNSHPIGSSPCSQSSTPGRRRDGDREDVRPGPSHSGNTRLGGKMPTSADLKGPSQTSTDRCTRRPTVVTKNKERPAPNRGPVTSAEDYLGEFDLQDLIRREQLRSGRSDEFSEREIKIIVKNFERRKKYHLDKLARQTS